VLAASADGLTLTLHSTVGAGSGLSIAFSAPTFENFGIISNATNSGDVTMAAVGSSPSANGASLSGQVLTLQPADDTHPGLLSILAQAIAGVKTFADGLISSAFVALGSVTPSGLSGTATAYVAARLAGNGALWFASSPSTTNYAIGSGAAGTDTTVNTGAGGSIFLAIANTVIGTLTSLSLTVPKLITAGVDGVYQLAWGTSGFYPNGGGTSLVLDVNGGQAASFAQTLTSFTGALRSKGHQVTDYTDGSGTSGNQTIDKYRGKCKIAAGGSTVTITNNLVDTNSFVQCVIETNDSTAILKNVTKGSGSFTINIVACTADTVISFMVTN
jgi:hypothetical protein